MTDRRTTSHFPGRMEAIDLLALFLCVAVGVVSLARPARHGVSVAEETGIYVGMRQAGRQVVQSVARGAPLPEGPTVLPGASRARARWVHDGRGLILQVDEGRFHCDLIVAPHARMADRAVGIPSCLTRA